MKRAILLGTFCIAIISLTAILFSSCRETTDANSGTGDTVENTFPGAPTIVSANPDDARVTITWEAPSNTGTVNGDGTTGTITAYTLYYSETDDFTDLTASSVSFMNAGTALSADVDGLTNRTSYYFAITASNATGEGAVSNAVQATPFAANRVPGTPENVNANPGISLARISWSAPADTGIINGDGTTGTITAYTVYYSETNDFSNLAASSVSSQDAGTALSIDVDGLTNGTVYYFAITASNATGEGAVSNAVQASPFAANRVPGSPENVNANPGNNLAQISWTAPTDTGIINGDGTTGTITAYTVYYSETNDFSNLAASSISSRDAGTALSIDVDGLTNGTVYYFAVTASNATGEGAVSNAVQATPFAANRVPGTPENVNANPGISLVQISWTAPADTGIINGDGTTGSITAYTVYYSETNDFSDLAVSSISSRDAGTALSIDVDGLTNGTVYYFAITASNATGEGTVSNAMQATPFAANRAPGQPENVNANPGISLVQISWTAPADTGIINGDGTTGSITAYTVYYSETNDFSDLAVSSISSRDAGTAHSVDLDGLTIDTTYYFAVTASNATGVGAISNVVQATPFAANRVPGSPEIVNAISANNLIKISWSAPADTGIINGDGTTGTITAYTVYYSQTNDFSNLNLISISSKDAGTALSVEVDGLRNLTPYYFTVTASNLTGNSPISNVVQATPFAANSAPKPPSIHYAIPGNTNVKIFWDPPTDTGVINGDGTKGTITAYTVYYSETNDFTDLTASSISSKDAGTAISVMVDGLTNGTTYYFAVTATNATGESAVSNVESGTPQIANRVPGLPENVIATPGTNLVNISWSSPVDTGTINNDGTPAIITSYTVYYSTTNNFSDLTASSVSSKEAGTALSVEVDGLTNGTPYYFAVTASNTVGMGAVSNVVEATPYVANRVPGPPVQLGIFPPGVTSVRLYWSSPDDTGIINSDGTTGIITAYTVYYSETNDFSDLTASSVSSKDAGTSIYVDIDGLTSGTTYYFVVTASNATGMSSISATTSAWIKLPNRAPESPKNIYAIAGSNKVHVSWEAPDDFGLIKNDGTTGVITHYTIYYSINSGEGKSGTPVTTSSGASTSIDVSGLTIDQTYYFVVTASNQDEESVASSEASVTNVKSYLRAKNSNGEYVIPDSHLTASSFWNADGSGAHVPYKGRLGSDSVWAALSQDIVSWWQVELIQEETINGVLCGTRWDGYDHFITSFYLEISSDGTYFSKVQLNGSDYLFDTGFTNSNRSTKSFEFADIGITPITAKYIRFNIQSFTGSKSGNFDVW